MNVSMRDRAGSWHNPPMKKLVLLLALACASCAPQAAVDKDVTKWEKQAQNVTITRDDWGIAHVTGKTDADAVFGVMYAQAEEYGRTGFQGGLEGYRTGATGRFTAEQQLFSGRTIDQPSMFVSGKSDWGVYQNPGAVERMQKDICTRMTGVHLLDGAGHWVQQEQPAAVSKLLVEFLQRKP